MSRIVLSAMAIAVAVLVISAAAQADRHAGYYYPEPNTYEKYTPRGPILDGADRRRRIGFVVGLTQGMLNRPYPPDFVIFAKGEFAEKMIIVSLREGFIDTLYRARALLAQLTAVARTTPIIQEYGAEDYFTFYDFVRLMGFEQLTISDGKSYAHQVTFE